MLHKHPHTTLYWPFSQSPRDFWRGMSLFTGRMPFLMSTALTANKLPKTADFHSSQNHHAPNFYHFTLKLTCSNIIYSSYLESTQMHSGLSYNLWTSRTSSFVIFVNACSICVVCQKMYYASLPNETCHLKSFWKSHHRWQPSNLSSTHLFTWYGQHQHRVTLWHNRNYY